MKVVSVTYNGPAPFQTLGDGRSMPRTMFKRGEAVELSTGDSGAQRRSVIERFLRDAADNPNWSVSEAAKADSGKPRKKKKKDKSDAEPSEHDDKGD